MKRQLPLLFVFIFGIFTLFQYFVPHESSEWVYEFLLDWIYIIGIFALALGIWSLMLVAVAKIKTQQPHWRYSYVTIVGLFWMILFGFSAPNGDAAGPFYYVFMLTFILTILMIVQAMAIPSKAVMYSIAAAFFLVSSILISVFDSSWSFYFYTQEGLENMMFRRFFDFVMIPIMATIFSLLAFFIASAAYRAFRARNVLASLLLISALIVMLRFNPYLAPIFGDYMARTSSWLMNVPNLAAQRAIVMGVGLGIVATALKVILGIERGYMGRG